METQNPIAVQHAALKSLIEDVYGQNLKSFLVDVAEVVESLTNNQPLIEALWECAAILQITPNNPK